MRPFVSRVVQEARTSRRRWERRKPRHGWCPPCPSTCLPELLAQVEGGATFVITRHGRPIARLLPIQPRNDGHAPLASRADRRLEAPIRELIDEGRR